MEEKIRCDTSTALSSSSSMSKEGQSEARQIREAAQLSAEQSIVEQCRSSAAQSSAVQK